MYRHPNRITVDQLHSLMGTRHVRLVDVRAASDFEHGHIAGSTSIPLDRILSNPPTVTATDTIYLLCRDGSKANSAARLLSRRGEDYCVIAGGLLAWAALGYPIQRTQV